MLFGQFFSPALEQASEVSKDRNETYYAPQDKIHASARLPGPLDNSECGSYAYTAGHQLCLIKR